MKYKMSVQSNNFMLVKEDKEDRNSKSISGTFKEFTAQLVNASPKEIIVFCLSVFP